MKKYIIICFLLLIVFNGNSQDNESFANNNTLPVFETIFIKTSKGFNEIELINCSKRRLRKKLECYLQKEKYTIAIDTKFGPFYKRGVEFSNDSLGIKFIFLTKRIKYCFIFKKEISPFLTTKKKRLNEVEIRNSKVIILNDLIIGKSTIEDIKNKFGTPDFINSYNNNIVYDNNKIRTTLWLNSNNILTGIDIEVNTVTNSPLASCRVDTIRE